MPGVTYSRDIQFTPRGPVVTHVIIGPKPEGLYRLKPVLSNSVILGREKVTLMQRRFSATASVAGVNGDLFTYATGNPSGVLIQDGVLKSPPATRRSSIGIDAAGQLVVERLGFNGSWTGSGQRRRLLGLNRPFRESGVMLYTPSWGATTPPGQGTVEAVLSPFQTTLPNTDLTGRVAFVSRSGGTRIPADGAVLVARGSHAEPLVAEAPPGQVVTVRLGLRPDWSRIVDALGGGPALVRNGRPVFRAFEEFPPDVLVPRQPRTAVGQRADGRIIFVAVDGRQPGYSVGMTIFALAQTLFRLGAVTGSALDGGGSTTMAFDGKLLNRPSGPGGERAVSEALLLFYYGVNAPPPEVPVLSPNGDGIDEQQTLSYKVVRPANVTARLLGPDNVPRHSETRRRQPGVYRLLWPGRRPDGSAEAPGRWRWVVSAVDDDGQRSSVERAFTLNPTLGFVRVRPAALRLRARGSRVVASYRLAHRASVTARVETASGAVVRRFRPVNLNPGQAAHRWNGRSDRGALVFSGRYLIRVAAVNQFGRSELTRSFTIRRLAPLRRPRPAPRKPRGDRRGG